MSNAEWSWSGPAGCFALITEYETRHGVKFSLEQHDVLYHMLQSYYGTMSQGRGAGKTFLLDALREITGE